MAEKSVFQKNFHLPDAYNYLFHKGLEHESNEIEYSTDKYKSYRSTIKRAKIIILLIEKNLLDDFCQKVWTDGLTPKGKTRIKFLINLIDRFKSEQSESSEDNESDDTSIEETAFAYEDDLQNFLLKNLTKIEKGLTLYSDENGISGEQFVIPGTSRRIDILAKDENNQFVVIELKVSRGHERVIGQILYYQSKIREIFNVDKVRGVIVAKELSEELISACKYLSDIELFEYQLSFSINKHNKS